MLLRLRCLAALTITPLPLCVGQSHGHCAPLRNGAGGAAGSDGSGGPGSSRESRTAALMLMLMLPLLPRTRPAALRQAEVIGSEQQYDDRAGVSLIAGPGGRRGRRIARSQRLWETALTGTLRVSGGTLGYTPGFGRGSGGRSEADSDAERCTAGPGGLPVPRLPARQR